MQDNKYSFSQKKQGETDTDYLKILQEENHRLRTENADLRKALEKEEFLHKNLYKQWTELNALALIKDRESKRIELKRTFFGNLSKYSFYALLLILIVFTFYFFSKGDKKPGSSQTLADIRDTVNPAMKVQSAKDTKQENEDAVLSSSKQVPANNPSITPIQETTKTFNKYRVKTKAFFYNNPDEGARRNIFLLPYEGSYGMITPLDDKNGFIYIVFTNHVGRTSKGWIRKSDLEPVN